MCIKQSNSHSWQHPCTDWFQRLRPRSVLCLRALSRSVLCLRSPLLPLVLASTGFTLVFALAMSSFGRATQLLAKVERALHQRKIGLRQCHTFHASRKRGREGGREGERETRTKGWREITRKPRIPLPWLPLCRWRALATALLEHHGSSFQQAEHEQCFRPSRPPAQARSWPPPRSAPQTHLRHMREQKVAVT